MRLVKVETNPMVVNNYILKAKMILETDDKPGAGSFAFDRNYIEVALTIMAKERAVTKRQMEAIDDVFGRTKGYML